jgi:hypothetical protein
MVGTVGHHDQRIAGLEMKLIGGAILFTMIGVVFFKWYAEERKTEGWDAVEWTRTERELRPPLGRPSEAHR